MTPYIPTASDLARLRADIAADRTPHIECRLIVKKVRVMWPDRRGSLVWRWAWQVGDDPPQATRLLAINWHKDFAP